MLIENLSVSIMHHTQACILSSVLQASLVQGLEPIADNRHIYTSVCDISCGSPLDGFQLNIHVGMGIRCWRILPGDGQELNMTPALLT